MENFVDLAIKLTFNIFINMSIGIYKILSPSGAINIGQSWNIEQRKRNYSQLGCKGQTKLYNSLVKYGWKAHKFDIIYELPIDINQEILDQYEILYWKQYKDSGFNMMNIREPGSRGRLNEETKQLIKNHPNRGQNISLSLKGRKFSKEHIKNLSSPKSDSHKQKMSQSSIGKSKSFNHIQNMKLGKLGKGGKQIICINDSKIFNTLKEAGEYYNINPRTIQNITSGLSKQTKNKLKFKLI